MKNLLFKMLKCQDIAAYWRGECEKLLEKSPGEDEDRDWKALALLTDAYGEWSKDHEAKLALQQGLWVISVARWDSSDLIIVVTILYERKIL